MKFRYPELEIHKRNNETLHRTLRKMVIHRNTSWHSAKLKFKVRNLYNIDNREGASFTF
jgi:hypothetical protein